MSEELGNQQPLTEPSTIKLSELEIVRSCGSFLLPFSSIAILLQKVGNEAVEHEFYRKGAPINQYYRKGDIEFQLNAQKMLSKSLFSPAVSPDGKTTRIDNNAYSALQEERKKNKAAYERERADYQRRKNAGQ